MEAREGGGSAHVIRAHSTRHARRPQECSGVVFEHRPAVEAVAFGLRVGIGLEISMLVAEGAADAPDRSKRKLRTGRKLPRCLVEAERLEGGCLIEGAPRRPRP